LRAIWRHFVEAGGPVPVAALVAEAVPGLAAAIRQAVQALAARDLIEVAGETVQVAYPFSGDPTRCPVELAGGAIRYACRAIDALGVAPNARRRGDRPRPVPRHRDGARVPRRSRHRPAGRAGERPGLGASGRLGH